ncbi:hypothetical protein [Variovorax paradoxus]|uniref:hypothetical protein n=1 Tax=Variovorax paradoxus TaxID=34073 RepID=UPI003D645DE9
MTDSLTCSAARFDWLRQLVKVGQVSQFSFSGYSNRYAAKAGDVLPLLADGPPAHRGPPIIGKDYVMPGNWTRNVIFHQDKIAVCPPDQVLTTDA